MWKVSKSVLSLYFKMAQDGARIEFPWQKYKLSLEVAPSSGQFNERILLSFFSGVLFWMLWLNLENFANFFFFFSPLFSCRQTPQISESIKFLRLFYRYPLFLALKEIRKNDELINFLDSFCLPLLTLSLPPPPYDWDCSFKLPPPSTVLQHEDNFCRKI